MNGLEFKIGAQEEAITTLKTEVAALREDIAEIKELIAGTKGSIRTLVGVSTIAASLGAFVAEAIHWFRHS